MSNYHCSYCHGNHASAYCPGYHNASLNIKAGEIRESISSFATLNQDTVREISSGFQAMREGMVSFEDAQESMANAIADGSNTIVDAISSTCDEVGDRIDHAGNLVAGRIDQSNSIFSKGFGTLTKGMLGGAAIIGGGFIAGAAILSYAIAGVGAILMYRERMDALRHEENLKFQEETSDAGRARRELLAASALIFAGDSSRAQRHVLRSIDLYPSAAESFRLLAITQDLEGYHEQACKSLKAAIKLAEDGHYAPIFRKDKNMQRTQTVEPNVVPIVGQLAHEMALIHQADGAAQMVHDYCGRYPSNRDLHFLRLRMLSKTNLWEREAADCISGLVTTWPEYFNLVYVDAQLGNKLPDAQQILSGVRQNFQESVSNKEHVLMLLSKGQFRKSQMETILNFSFSDLSTMATELDRKIVQIAGESPK